MRVAKVGKVMGNEKRVSRGSEGSGSKGSEEK